MKNQTERIMEHLAKHGSITPIEALNLYGSFRLGSIICRFRKEGVGIDTIMVPTPSGRTKYAKYVLRR